jgi:hypothetical protein
MLDISGTDTANISLMLNLQLLSHTHTHAHTHIYDRDFQRACCYKIPAFTYILFHIHSELIAIHQLHLHSIFQHPEVLSSRRLMVWRQLQKCAQQKHAGWEFLPIVQLPGNLLQAHNINSIKFQGSPSATSVISINDFFGHKECQSKCSCRIHFPEQKTLHWTLTLALAFIKSMCPSVQTKLPLLSCGQQTESNDRTFLKPTVLRTELAKKSSTLGFKRKQNSSIGR